MKKLKDFVMIETQEMYEDSLLRFLSYFLDNLNDQKLKELINRKNLYEIFDYLWKNHREVFLNKDIQTVFERYILIKSHPLNDLDIILNLSKNGIYLKEIDMEKFNIKDNCLKDEENEKYIYNIENIIKQYM
jgi:hypothetical protein